MRGRYGVGRGLLTGVAIGLLAQPIPWLRWWTETPHHQSLRWQWHESLYIFGVLTLAGTVGQVLRARKQGKPSKGA
jgi:hypothetical protein